MSKFQFSNVVVVENNLIGVVVKSWSSNTHEVYVRYFNEIREYKEEEIHHFIYSKYLDEEEVEWYE